MSDERDKTWCGQPRGLTILFLTNMWELFSYYGMRTLLVYYMTKQLFFTQQKASLVYGSYTLHPSSVGSQPTDGWVNGGPSFSAAASWRSVIF